MRLPIGRMPMPRKNERTSLLKIRAPGMSLSNAVAALGGGGGGGGPTCGCRTAPDGRVCRWDRDGGDGG